MHIDSKYLEYFPRKITWQEKSHNLGPLLLTWYNFNSSMDNNHMPSEVWDEIIYSFPHCYALAFWTGYAILSHTL